MDWLRNLFGLEVPGTEELELDVHRSVVDSDPYSFQVAHRRLAWMFRGAVMIIVMMTGCIMLLSGALWELMPLKTTEIALVKTSCDDNRLYWIEPPGQTIDGFEVLLEDKARRFVRNVLTMDSVTQSERFKEAFRIMSQSVYAKFKKERLDSGKVKKAINSGLNRSITVESVNKVETFGTTHKLAVDFIQTDERSGEVIEVKKLRAYLNITTTVQKALSVAAKYENPLGITIIDFVIKERGNL